MDICKKIIAQNLIKRFIIFVIKLALHIKCLYA